VGASLRSPLCFIYDTLDGYIRQPGGEDSKNDDLRLEQKESWRGNDARLCEKKNTGRAGRDRKRKKERDATKKSSRHLPPGTD